MTNVFAMDNVRCNGTEARLEDCYHLDSDDCGELEGAGVVCRRGFNKLKQLVSVVKIKFVSMVFSCRFNYQSCMFFSEFCSVNLDCNDDQHCSENSCWESKLEYLSIFNNSDITMF